MPEYNDFQEIAHCGGKVTFRIECDLDGNRSYSQGFHHDRPTPASWISIYALAANAQPVSDVRMGGEGQPFDPQPQPGWLPVFLGSDSHLCWGHQCPRCRAYFRNGRHPAIYPLTCPYCGLRAAAFRFLTSAQLTYIRHYVETLQSGLEEDITPGTGKEIVIDMDAIADRGAQHPKPDFYYTTEAQQTRYKCDHCGDFNDIRGRFGYCASCAWRNNTQSLKEVFSLFREKLNAGQSGPVEVVKSAVSEFDASCRDMTAQIVRRVPMKPARKAELQRLVFHDLESATIDRMRSMLDIDLLRGIAAADLGFARMMFHRRHVYEHNAGVADPRYVKESGDPNAKDGVLLRETHANAHRLVGILNRIIENFGTDFHEIFPPTEWPIRYHQQRRADQTGRAKRNP